jgi:hypothetical protein
VTDFPWSKFFWSDWESDQGLRLCSLAAQGLWMRMLCVCAKHEPKGYLAINGHPLTVDAIARLAGVTETEAGNLVAELDRNGVFSRNRSGCIYSRRMVRDEKRSQEGRKHKKQALAQANEKQRENPPPSRGATRGPSPHMPEARSQKESASALSPPSGFDAFWDAFPKKVEKRGAKAKFDAAVRRGVPPDKIINAARLYASSRSVREGFIAHPTTWLNNGRWDDEPEALPSQQPHASPEADRNRAFLRKIAGG